MEAPKPRLLQWGLHRPLLSDPVIRTLLIDNHDSFTWNLVHDLTRVNGVAPVVLPNDWDQWGEQGADLLDHIDNVVISPGPGTPVNPVDVGIAPAVIAAAVENAALRPCQHRIADPVADHLVDLDQPPNLPSTLARERAVT